MQCLKRAFHNITHPRIGHIQNHINFSAFLSNQHEKASHSSHKLQLNLYAKQKEKISRKRTPHDITLRQNDKQNREEHAKETESSSIT